MRDAESILEDILTQLERSGQNSGGISQSTAEQMRDLVKEQKEATRREGGRLMGEAASSLQSLNNSTSTVSDAMPALGKGFKGLGFKILPGFGTAVGLAADAAEAFYNYMNDSLNVYKSFNAAGIQTTDGMLGLSSALAHGRLTADEFQNAIADTRDVLASMGADGTREFGSMVKTLIEAQETQGYLNLTNEQMAKYIASNLKQQKAYGVFDKLNRAEQDASNRDYVQRMSDMSKALGISTDQLVDNMNKNIDSVQGFGTALALQNRGMDAGTAADTTNTLNSVLGSFGQFGDQFGEQFARFLEYGQVDLESPVGQMYQTSTEIQNLFNNMRDMALSGELATKDGAKALQGMLDQGGLVKDIDQSIGQIRAAFGDQAANQVIAMRNQLNNYNAEVAKVDDFWNNVINDFNTTIEGVFFGFKEGTANLFTDPKDFIYKMFGGDNNAWAKWIVDGIWDFDIGEQPALVQSGWELLKTIFSPFGWVWDAMNGYVENVQNNLKNGPPSWETILRAICPSWLADIIIDGDPMTGGLKGAEDMANSIDEALGDLSENVGNYFGEVGGDVADHLTNVGNAGLDFFEGAAESLSSWWDKPSSQHAVEKVVTNNMTSLPETITKPSDADAIEKALQPLVDGFNKTQDNNDNTEMLLERLNEYMEALVGNSQQQLREQRKGNSGGSQIN